MDATTIHPTSVVEKGAELDKGVVIGPFCYIGPHVFIGRNTVLHSHVSIQGRTRLGQNNTIYSHASLGHIPQDLKYKDEPTTLDIGNFNSIRENATIHLGTVQGLSKTVIGNHNLIMNYTHIAHDCIIHDHTILSNGAQLAGHVEVMNHAVIAGMAGIHQFVRLGESCLVAGGSMVVQDVPPYCIVEGNRATLKGLNIKGLRRDAITPETRMAIKIAYKNIFLDQHPTIEEACAEILKNPDLDMHEVKTLMHFVQSSQRGVTRPHRSNENMDS